MKNAQLGWSALVLALVAPAVTLCMGGTGVSLAQNGGPMTASIAGALIVASTTIGPLGSLAAAVLGTFVLVRSERDDGARAPAMAAVIVGLSAFAVGAFVSAAVWILGSINSHM
ncbi:MAG: hypothetical protein M3Y87_14370 [Myxococcota bacterium]|nr:hypothetical protein [Myxococcota bacterium]